jgi:hypothetical protein
VVRWAAAWGEAVLGLLILLLIGTGILAQRLAEGPLSLPPLARAIEAAANDGAAPHRVSVDSAALVWRGFGDASPIEIRLAGVVVGDARGTGRAELPEAAVTLALAPLLQGQVAPRRVTLRGLTLRLAAPAGGGGLTLDPGGGEASIQDMLAPLLRPAVPGQAMATLETIRIEDARLLIDTLGTLEVARLDVTRRAEGGVALAGTGQARKGEATLPLSLAGSLDPAGIALRVETSLDRPGALLPALAPVEAPVAVRAALRLGLDGALQAAEADLSLGAGRLALGGAPVALAGGSARLLRAAAGWQLADAQLRLAGAGAPTLTASGSLLPVAGGRRAELALALDRVALAALPGFWPEPVLPPVRSWITENITAGEASDGRWAISLDLPDGGAPALHAASGSLAVAGATVHWLRPVPPVEGAGGRVLFGLDAVRIELTAGRLGALTLRGGEAKFSFLPNNREQLDLQLGLFGPVPAVMTLLQHPRLRLFDQRPLEVQLSRGQLDGTLSVSLPLLADLPMEAVRISARARLRDLRIEDVAAGRPLERGQVDLSVDQDGLRAQGMGALAGIGARLGVELDFRRGLPTQIIQRETIAARVTTADLARLGLPVEEVVRGPIELELRVERQRSGAGRATLRADLRGATLLLAPLAYGKPPGAAASAEATLRLDQGRLASVDSFRVEAPGLRLRGNASLGRRGQLERLTLNEAVVEESRFVAEARPPGAPGGPWAVSLRGQTLDLRRALAPDEGPPPAAEPDPRTPVLVEARFERVLLGPRRSLADVEVRAGIDGAGVIRQGRIAGRAGERGAFLLEITPEAGTRRFDLTAEDAGALLRAFDMVEDIEGGRLTVRATYAHDRAAAPLAGRAEMADFSVRNAPAFAKLLQALTLFGLVEALSGPGLGFSRLVAPFTLTPEALTLDEARAFSASLGLTARGTLHRQRKTLAMEGTIVPAYLLNTLLGNLPLVGRLFSPEQGGGLFAATYRMGGPLGDPQVSVNPLAALTPGFLRGIFGGGPMVGPPPQ